MDPHASNGMIDESIIDQEKTKELYVYEKMDAVVLQPNALLDLSNEIKSRFCKKLFGLRFPLVIPTEYHKRDCDFFVKGSIHCVYAGALMLPIRMPDYMVRLFGLMNSNDVQLHIWSNNLALEQKRQLESMLSENEILHEPVSQLEMHQILESADVMVNLGNTTTNQFPSKVLDYISLGKPIINIYKNKNCPTLEVLDKYPLSISLYEGDDIQTNADRLRSFIHDSFGKTIGTDEINRIFYDYRPSYVASEILKTIWPEGRK